MNDMEPKEPECRVVPEWSSFGVSVSVWNNLTKFQKFKWFIKELF